MYSTRTVEALEGTFTFTKEVQHNSWNSGQAWTNMNTMQGTAERSPTLLLCSHSSWPEVLGCLFVLYNFFPAVQFLELELFICNDFAELVIRGLGEKLPLKGTLGFQPLQTIYTELLKAEQGPFKFKIIKMITYYQSLTRTSF